MMLRHAVSAAVVAAVAAHEIEHVVLLMEENRGFDHMCGYFPGVNGLTGKEYNLLNTSDPNSKRYYATNDSPYIGPFDPDHGVPGTTGKIFGNTAGTETGKETMGGFAQWEAQRHGHKDPSSVMQAFTPERLPIMSTLSKEFVLFDQFYCSVPGPTWPNRLFQLLGTSDGDTSTSHFDKHSWNKLYKGRTVFHQLEDKGLSWRFYYHDVPLEMAFIEKVMLSPTHVHPWERFKRDAREGKLPNFSWLNPRWFADVLTGEGANDQHPDHDVRLGEALMKEVYEELRASPQWNKTLFIITYDEHGGFYDHVVPPKAPKPDDATSFPDKFEFDRCGIRIPTLAISPWVAKGKIVSEPTQRPQPDSQFELTSILATMRNIFDLGAPLTRRDAWAAPFDDLLSQTRPRADCPAKLPDAPKSLGMAHAVAEAALPLNGLQTDILRSLAGAVDRNMTLPALQGEGAEWARERVEKLLKGQAGLQKRVKGRRWEEEEEEE